MKIGYKTITLFFILLSLLIGCEDKKDMTYIKGLPEEKSPALTGFMKHLITGNIDTELRNKDREYIYASGNLVTGSTDITYYQLTDDQLATFHEQLLQSENPSLTRNKLFHSEDSSTIRKPFEDIDNYSLPNVSVSEDYVINIKHQTNELTIDLIEEMKEYNITNESEFIINLIGANEKTIALEIDDQSNDNPQENYYLFINQDLTEYTITPLNEAGLKKALNNDEFDNYFTIFKGTDNYRITFNKTAIFNTETKEMTPVGENDLISEDGKYVFLNGYTHGSEDLSDGKHRIQTIENYAKGNDIYEREFTIDFGTISKELDFESKKVSIGYVYYFNKDFIVLTLSYHGKIIGDGGFTNVLIDLQDEGNLRAYLVDLGLM
ncbi:hypothetical protein [Salirhabdus sp. Marseille-P4669]|uniref:hypothetical protein n=1 Tax=Salirhabdus sp. Marseille-P4669 TaxID=2042310 RepID=UPI000C7A73AA|nr:hypothetical protein [Salirhabdus sp. Marseille-P4669]